METTVYNGTEHEVCPCCCCVVGQGCPEFDPCDCEGGVSMMAQDAIRPGMKLYSPNGREWTVERRMVEWESEMGEWWEVSTETSTGAPRFVHNLSGDELMGWGSKPSEDTRGDCNDE